MASSAVVRRSAVFAVGYYIAASFAELEAVSEVTRDAFQAEYIIGSDVADVAVNDAETAGIADR